MIVKKEKNVNGRWDQKDRQKEPKLPIDSLNPQWGLLATVKSLSQKKANV